MEAIESLDKECSALGGLFQQVVNEMKTGVPHYEDIVSKAAKLHTHLKGTIFALGAFLDSFQRIADSASNTKGATREIGACLTRIVIRHKSVESRLKALCSALLECMVLPMQDKLEEWRKSALQMDKDHAKEYKKLRSEVRKRSEAVQRSIKKGKKAKIGSTDQVMANASLESNLSELTKNLKILEETEKNACRKALTEERSRYCLFVSSMRRILDEEAGMVSDFQQLEEINKKLASVTDEPFRLPLTSEQVITDMKSDGLVAFTTPPSSPSSLGSRKSSMCSISSAGSSNNGSPSHKAKGGQLQQQPLPAGNPARLSSVSSQDSGFTSQDTLFLRPASPNGRPLSRPFAASDQERPHTISTAYEKGHLRPQLQPYTFSPPESTMTIPECDQFEENQHSSTATLLRRPPVPQRVGQLSSGERPHIPNKTLAATMAAVKQHQLQQQQELHQQQDQGQVPNFTLARNDMVVPQPVYMNMNDLKALADRALYSKEIEDSPELKTPTAEDIIDKKVVDEGSSTSESSLGSSSGYGSQNTVTRSSENQDRNSSTLQQSSTHALNDGTHQNNLATLRRASMKPQPPTRRSSSVMSSGSGGEHHPQNYGLNGSNSTTPRSSMEHLPPPPPHLLHSDEDDFLPPPPKSILPQRASRSVAESVKTLQDSGHLPASPGSLRRAHSMVAPQTNHPGEQIYAPVAHLQQKIQQRRQNQHFNNAPEWSHDQYGFGMQFQQTQSQFYQQMAEAGSNSLDMSNSCQTNQQYELMGGDQDVRLRHQQPSRNDSGYDAQTALRVRRWIESKTVTNVADCRPYLNAEIQQGFALRKTMSMNDRSGPKF